MFDTHCHLNFKNFSDNINALIKEARENGVNNFCVPGTDIDNSKEAVRISQHFENIYSAVGFHPTNPLEEFDLKKVKKKLGKLVDEEGVVAVGETGLDYYHLKATRSTQIDFFRMHITLAKSTGLALIIHNRLAAEDTVKTLKNNWKDNLAFKSVFHCCEANGQLLDFALDKKIFIGVDGDVTYDEVKMEFIKKVPLELLVLETDSPFLLPEPLRSERRLDNSPANLFYVAQKLAELKKEPFEKVVNTTTKNAKRLFGLI